MKYMQTYVVSPLIGDILGGNHWMDLRVFSFFSTAYDELFRGKYGSAFVLEKYFFETIKNRWKQEHAGIFCRFDIQPNLIGFSGNSNKSYQSVSYKIKNSIRTVVRRVLPSLWL
ncbi:hypothetical protein METHB2_520003 [Candidatus Methylobacter favarea]|uniref:Uncharacterized protein n=1 Tax=Candidatus Methylobacter favarea TaxID=2707345 RepID=A0A8S0XTR6_9GAMM|nr:hypothetical protein METHB2_520003 [Candidatus Methylobacter favarea]